MKCVAIGTEKEVAEHMPTTVAVGMATFHRPALLARLIPQILEQIDEFIADADVAPVFNVVIVDNDPSASGRDAATSTGDARIHYVVEPEPGISSARNRILDESADCDILILIDDDELPHPGWLAHLLETHSRYGADAVSGPVHAVFEGGTDPWIEASGSYVEQQHVDLKTGSVRARAATNNLLLDMRTVRALGLRFDSRFGLTGGEDSLFTGQLTKAGGRIVWCAEAVVDDQVPTERNTRRFNLRRRLATSATHVQVEQKLLDSTAERVRGLGRWAVIGIGQVVKGASLAVAGRTRGHLGTRARGEQKFFSGLGVLSGCTGHLVSPYARKRGNK